MNSELFKSKQVLDLLRKYQVKQIGVFGSVARGEKHPNDIDLLAVFSKTPGLLKVVRLERELGDLLGAKVDLLTEKAISPYIRQEINRDLEIVYHDQT